MPCVLSEHDVHSPWAFWGSFIWIHSTLGLDHPQKQGPILDCAISQNLDWMACLQNVLVCGGCKPCKALRLHPSHAWLTCRQPLTLMQFYQKNYYLKIRILMWRFASNIYTTKDFGELIKGVCCFDCHRLMVFHLVLNINLNLLFYWKWQNTGRRNFKCESILHKLACGMLRK